MSQRLSWLLMGCLAGASGARADSFVPSVDDRMSAITGLMRIRELPPTPDVITKLIGYAGWQDPAVAGGAVRRLGELGPPAAEAIPVLLEGLKQLTAAGGENRGAQFPPSPPYAWALSRIGPGRWDVLTGLLEAAAAAAQRRRFEPHYVQSWRERTENGDTWLRRAVMDSSIPGGQRHMALIVLSMTKDSELVPQLQDLARDPALRPAVGQYAIRAIGDPTQILPMLVDLAVSQASSDAPFAERVFMRIRDSGSVDNALLIRKLLRLVFDPAHPFNGGWNPPEPQPLTSMAMSAINVISENAVVDKVGPFWEDPNVEIRRGVATACWSRVGEGEWATRFRSRLNSEDEAERTAFAVTLMQVPSCRSEAERVLLRSATSTTLTNVCRTLALRALSLNQHQLPLAREVREGVERCTHDSDPLVRKAALKILEYGKAHLSPAEP